MKANPTALYVLFWYSLKCFTFAYECCVLSAIFTQGLVPDERIFTALLTMHKTPKDYGWYMEVSQTLPFTLNVFNCY